jgi:hypothetical protein
MSAVSIFKNFVNKVEDKALLIITKEIKEGKYKSEIDLIRKYYSSGEIEKADKLKNKLLSFTTTGTFEGGRSSEKLIQYTGFIVLDIDDVATQELEIIKTKASKFNFTAAAFISPSGNGIKIIVNTNGIPENHLQTYNQVKSFYEKECNVTIDTSGKDLARTCFFSYDDNCYRNISPEKFLIDSVNIPPLNKTEAENVTNENPIQLTENVWLEKLNQCIDFTNKKSEFIKGNRNNFIHQFACNCNREGIPQIYAETFALQNYNYDNSEVKATIKSAYKNNAHDFAKYANIANSNTQEPTIKDEILLNMPYLPQEIFSELPSILKDGCSVFTDLRERDVFLTGALAIMSGCIPNMYGVYRAKEVYSNLFVFIIAPAASGKGALTFSKELGEKYHELLVKNSNEKRSLYKIELQEYKNRLVDKQKGSPPEEPPTEPPFKVLFIPANNSSARVIQQLSEGDEMGIFCETEADSMGNVLKQDWGSYSDLLRKSFHHEHISYSRKTNKELVEIKNPQLSVALAGTPSQVQNLIQSAEDGLFSRFIFYTFKTNPVWINANDTLNGINFTKHFKELSVKVLSFVEFLLIEEKIEFQLTPAQWDQLNNFGNETLVELSTFICEDLSSTAKRLGLILFRFCMILTALRYFDNAESSKTFICSDKDFSIALKLIKTYQEHSVFMFKELPKNASLTDKTMKTFFDSLPPNFQRKEAIALAELNFQIKERTADLYLRKLITAKLLDKTKSGMYQKVKN